jgi:hypothetical protein
MNEKKKTVVCPDCDAMERGEFDRREFLRASALATVAATTGATLWAEPRAFAAPTPSSPAETAVKALYETLTEGQRKDICFPWDHMSERGLLRTHVSNNWQITDPHINSEYFTKQQQTLIRDVFKGVFNPEWVKFIDKQLKDDTDGKPWGSDQSIAIFGKPGDGKFEFVMTGRHLTIRADGNTEGHVAFGGPIFHGHAASGFNEKVHHPGNIFWHQAVLANKLYQMLDGKQQKAALVEKRPGESAVKFRGPKGGYPGLPAADMSNDQKEHLQKVLMSLIEPYRKEDQEEVQACLKAQGGLEKCSLAFYKEGDLGEDGEWDNWRVEGPSFVWYFRGFPHVHIWINVADDPSVPLNARG